MKKLLILSILTFVIFSISFSQHPNYFISDVYDLEWVQNSKIKSLTSNDSKLTINTGVPISKKARKVKVSKDGREISQYQGRKGFFLYKTILNKDLNKIEETQMGNISKFYYYDSEGRLYYTVGNVDTEASTKIVTKNRLEEFERDFDGKLIQKEVFKYEYSLLDEKDDIARLRGRDDRDLIETWNYSYNDQGQLEEVRIKSWSSEKGKWITNTVTVCIENEMPVALKIELQGGGESFFGNDRKFTYSF